MFRFANRYFPKKKGGNEFEQTEKVSEMKEYALSPLWIFLGGLQFGVISLLIDVGPYCLRSESDGVVTHFWALQLFLHHAFGFAFGHWKTKGKESSVIMFISK